jgi:high-affinity nickel-transport protein
MAKLVPPSFLARSSVLSSRVASMFGFLALINIGAWIWALIAFHDFPLLMGTALLAYTFGLRHAVDADHIAAIDNVTRKLMQQGNRPVAVGFFFSLGHSTIVFGLSIAIALTSVALKSRFDSLESIGGIIGTIVSALFLLAIAVANIMILIGLSYFQTRQRRRTIRRRRPKPDSDEAWILRTYISESFSID